MIELQDIERVFRVGEEDVHALRRINLAIAAGAYVSIMGASGSGKSTLLNIIGLLDQPDHGLYRLAGETVSQLDPDHQAEIRQQRIGFVFQSFHLVPRLSAAQNIELPMILAGIDPGQRHERVRTALAAFGLADRARHTPAQLSGGQRQRVAIARATIMRPALILADEPTGNLDLHSGQEVMDILEDLNRQQGITLLLVTHDAALGGRAQRTLLMQDGGIVDDRRNR